MTKHDVAKTVGKYLADRRPAGVTLEVVEEGIHRVDDWWRVPLRPNALPEKMFPFYEELAEVEIEIQDKENLSVLFATGEPEEAKVA